MVSDGVKSNGDLGVVIWKQQIDIDRYSFDRLQNDSGDDRRDVAMIAAMSHSISI